MKKYFLLIIALCCNYYSFASNEKIKSQKENSDTTLSFVISIDNMIVVRRLYLTFYLVDNLGNKVDSIREFYYDPSFRINKLFYEKMKVWDGEILLKLDVRKYRSPYTKKQSYLGYGDFYSFYYNVSCNVKDFLSSPTFLFIKIRGCNIKEDKFDYLWVTRNLEDGSISTMSSNRHYTLKDVIF